MNLERLHGNMLILVEIVVHVAVAERKTYLVKNLIVFVAVPSELIIRMKGICYS